MEHVLTMANLKLKPSLFTPRPSVDGGHPCISNVNTAFQTKL